MGTKPGEGGGALSKPRRGWAGGQKTTPLAEQEITDNGSSGPEGLLKGTAMKARRLNHR